MREVFIEETFCFKCGCKISWDSRLEDDHRFSGVFGKMREHMANDPVCKRNVILDKLLEEKDEEEIRNELMWGRTKE